MLCSATYLLTDEQLQRHFAKGIGCESMPLEPIGLVEAARICGCFAAVLPDEAARSEVFDAFLACYRRVAGAGPEGRAIPLGDLRAFRAEALAGVFTSASPEGTLSWTPFTLQLRGDFERVWSSLSLTYLLPFLSDEGRRTLRAELERHAPSLADAQGSIPFELGLQLLEWRPRVGAR